MKQITLIVSDTKDGEVKFDIPVTAIGVRVKDDCLTRLHTLKDLVAKLIVALFEQLKEKDGSKL